jgi:hypothetical protein
MAQAVAIMKGGSIIVGEYDGYGRVDGFEIYDEITLEACLYHKKCWEIAGKPTKFVESEGSDDQGFFFDDGKYDKPEPVADGDSRGRSAV